MDDLTAFLNARLDEDEAAALAAGGDSWHATADGVYHEDIARQPGPFAVGPYDYLDDGERAHIALHDPARVLREVAADRKLITMWEEQDDYDLPEGVADGRDDDERVADEIMKGTLFDVLQVRAAVWCDHPGYRPEWKP